MKTVFLHGLGQTARAWDEVVRLCPGLEADCPDLFSLPGSGPSYDRLLSALEGRYAGESGPLRLCGLSLGAVLALDYAARHPDQVRQLVLIAPQYRTPRPLFALQDVMFLPGGRADQGGDALPHPLHGPAGPHQVPPADRLSGGDRVRGAGPGQSEGGPRAVSSPASGPAPPGAGGGP